MDPTGHPYQQLTPDLVMDAVESQGFVCDCRTLALNSYENRVYQIGIEDGAPLIAKFYRPERWTDEAILEEHRFCLELAEHELPVVTPWQNAEGQTLFHYNGFSFALFPRQGGHAPELDNLDNLLILGRLLGRLHRIGAIRPFEHRPRLDAETFGRQSVAFIAGFIPEGYRANYLALSGDLLQGIDAIFTQVALDPIRVHGDLHAGNILWRDGAPHLVDLDDARLAPAVQDIWMMLSGERTRQLAQLAEIVAGYEDFYTFPARQLRLIEPLRSLRILHHGAWLARRWHDPTFPHHFPWFNTPRYWDEHILQLREQIAALSEPPLQVP